MGGYIFDLVTVALIIIGLTATIGVLTNGIGNRFFGGKKRSEYVVLSNKMQVGWKAVGGNKQD